MRQALLALSLIAGTSAFAPTLLAGDDEVAARLTRQIDAMTALLQPGGKQLPAAALADSLIEAKARTQLFRLEGLLRLYLAARPELNKYRLEVKELEDSLGAYTFASDSLSFAKDRFKAENQGHGPDAARDAAQARVIEALNRQKDSAHADFAKLVGKSSLVADLPKLRSLVVSKFAGWTASKDVGYVKGELVRMLKNVKDGTFDFNKLESGIHEYRRRLRWIPIAIDSLDGLILVGDNSPMCPVPALASLAGTSAARHRYSNPPLRFPSTHGCTISRCLLWQVVKTTNDLGDIKDEAQGNTAIGAALEDDLYIAPKKVATPEQFTRAKTMRTELLSSHALDSLITQVSACK